MNEMSSSICLQPNGVWHDHVKKVAQVANWSVSLSVTDSSAGALLTAELRAPRTYGWIETEAPSKGPHSVESEWRREDYFSAGIVTFKCMRTISASILAPSMGADDHLPPRRIWITRFLRLRLFSCTDVTQAQDHGLLSLPLYLICSLSSKLLFSLIKQEADGQLEARVSIQARRATVESRDARASAC